MHAQLKRLGASIERHAERKGFQKEWAWRRSLKNNSIWWNALSARDYLAILGRNVRLGPMLGRDTYVGTRLIIDQMELSELTHELVSRPDLKKAMGCPTPNSAIPWFKLGIGGIFSRKEFRFRLAEGTNLAIFLPEQMPSSRSRRTRTNTRQHYETQRSSIRKTTSMLPPNL